MHVDKLRAVNHTHNSQRLKTNIPFSFFLSFLLFNGALRLYSAGDRMLNEYGAVVEWELEEEIQVLGENLAHCHFSTRKSHIT